MIRPASIHDLPAISALYDEVLAADALRSVPYTNWQKGAYPTVQTARLALNEGTLWAAEEEGELYGTFILNGMQLPEYENIAWTFPAPPKNVAVIHTLAISPHWAGRGKGRVLVAFCEEESRRQGKTVLRLDTYKGNLPANQMYQKLGYRFAGGTEFLFQDYIQEILNCYEKAL